MKKVLFGVLGAAVLVAAVLTAAIVFGTSERPPTLQSVVDTATRLDRTGVPALSTFAARDGTPLAYRLYPGTGPRIAVLFHGSSDSSLGMHAVGRALAGAGVTAYAFDVRGHGGSGPAGDIAYIGQLEDDVADLVGHIRATHPAGPIAAVGHSSGGGFVLRLMGSDTNKLFDTFVATSPYLHYRAPTSRGADGGGWARPFVPRIVALALLSRLHIPAFGGLPVVAFALPPDAPGTKTYSFRLFRNYAPHDDYVGDVRRNGRELTVVAGTADEVFRAERYADAFEPVRPMVHVTLLPGLKHMDVVASPVALQAVVDAVNHTAPAFSPVASAR